MESPSTPTLPNITPLLNPSDMARLLRVSKAYIYKLAQRGTIPCIRWEAEGTGTKRKRDMVRFTQEDALAFIRENRR